MHFLSPENQLQKARKPLKYKEKPPFLAVFPWWR
jgi:hypothetical protein